jgi:hypothetical protein
MEIFLAVVGLAACVLGIVFAATYYLNRVVDENGRKP